MRFAASPTASERSDPSRCAAAAPSRGVRGSDRGSQTVEWTLVTALLVVLWAALIQFTVAGYARNVLADIAAETAVAAAREGADGAMVRRRAHALIDAALSPGFERDVRIETSPVPPGSGPEIVTVRIFAALPLIALAGPPRAVEVIAHAPLERPGP